MRVGDSKSDLRATVEARLDVGESVFKLGTCRSEINYFDVSEPLIRKQDVFWL